MSRREQELLRAWASESHLRLSPRQIDLLDIYLEELNEWNQKINLTGMSSKEDIIRELVLDSMIPAPFLPDCARYLDVGSGAGFPGIPLAIYKPRWSVLLLEPNIKRANFLAQVIRLTKLTQTQVISRRVENSGNLLHPEGYHVVSARALAPLAQVLKWCIPHLALEGLFVNFQGPDVNELLAENFEPIRQYRLSLHKTIPYVLPGKDSSRNILIFKKDGP